MDGCSCTRRAPETPWQGGCGSIAAVDFNPQARTRKMTQADAFPTEVGSFSELMEALNAINAWRHAAIESHQATCAHAGEELTRVLEEAESQATRIVELLDERDNPIPAVCRTGDVVASTRIQHAIDVREIRLWLCTSHGVRPVWGADGARLQRWQTRSNIRRDGELGRLAYPRYCRSVLVESDVFAESLYPKRVREFRDKAVKLFRAQAAAEAGR